MPMSHLARFAATTDPGRARGIDCERFDRMGLDGRSIWPARSRVRAAWPKDRDGNILSLTEMPE